MKRKKNRLVEYDEFLKIIKPVATNQNVLLMKNYRQHCNTSCYEHCFNAAFHCYAICKELGLDYKSATRAAMLHDFFLYDWRVNDGTRKKLHALHHGKIAYENASKIYKLNKIEKDMIINHMWPVTLRIPKTREGLILTLVDKYCATNETFKYMKEKYLLRFSIIKGKTFNMYVKLMR